MSPQPRRLTSPTPLAPDQKITSVLAQVHGLDLSYSELWRLRRVVKAMEDTALVREKENALKASIGEGLANSVGRDDRRG